MHSYRLTPSLIALVGAVLAAPVAAQTTVAAAKPADDSGLAEIVVTAEKRSSTIQDTAISMSALSGEQLQQEGISGITGVVQSVPGLSMRTSGPGQTELEMRGLSSSGGSSPTVGFYLDDYPLTAPAAALVGKVVIDPDLYDLNRVEVLRGPQGTLYGSGSMGGTVKLVTNEPILNRFEGSVDAFGSGTSGGGFNRGGNLMLNVPLLADTFAMRIVATDKYRDGWITRYVEPDFPVPTNPGPCGPGWPGCTRGDVTAITPSQSTPRINWERLQGGRVEFLAQPTAALKIEATAIYQKITMGDYDEYDLPPGITDARFQPNNNSEPISDEFKLYGLTASYDLGFAELTSASAYYSRTESQTQDTSEALYSLLPLYGVTISQFYPNVFNETDTTRQFSEELRVASTGTGPLQWIAGAFFSHFQSIFAEYNASIPIVANAPGELAVDPAGILYQANNPYHIKQYAIFGEGTYAFTENWKLTAGARWYKFDSRADEETEGYLATSGSATPLLNTFVTSNTGVNPKVTVSYEQNHDLTIYGTASRGFRPGGINQQIPDPPCTLATEAYGPDSIWNYEIGEKAKLLDNRVIINADVYYIRWSQVQQSVNQPCGYPLTQNAGTAASYGPEVEITALLTPELTLAFSGTYTHATLTSVNATLEQADTAFTPGLGLLNVPKYTETTSLTYVKPISDNLKFSARLNNSYVGQATDIDFTYGTLPSYNLVGLRFGLLGEKLSGFVFADNLTDKRAQLGINTTGFAYTIPSLIRVATNQPRTIGVDVKYRF
ncbi:MAG TPA: TonB-dependent receptor [Steroidobacteraceae bacterium]|jgi:iron complex outermembrane receptor protein|nr:TonB-dependent receptor [Steroidobacteraceae bacterium]